MVTIEVDVAPAYSAHIEAGLLARAGGMIQDNFEAVSTFYAISVAPVRKIWGDSFQSSFAAAGRSCEILEMKDGEHHKTLATVENLASRLVRGSADRKSVLVGFGGGVVGDVTGFLASIFMRGIPCVQVPTSLLAQIDAAIGGKTGVDLREGKNLVGTFHHPRLVVIDPNLLSTLPEREYRSGLFEALKCGIIASPETFRFMEENREPILQRDPAALQWLIAECVRIKAGLVTADEKDCGARRTLNFGHTVGHALEAETAYREFLHGEAVAWGMVASAMIAAALQRTDLKTAQRIISAVLAYAPLPRVTSRGKRIARRLSADKKTVGGKVHFVLPVTIGSVEIVSDVPERAVIQAVEELRYLSGG